MAPDPNCVFLTEQHREAISGLIYAILDRKGYLVLTGEVDYRTPMSESEQFYQALKLRKVETVLVRVPGAPHDIAQRPSHMMAKATYVLKWFELHRQRQ